MVNAEYTPVLHTTAERELNNLPDPEKSRLTQLIKDIAGLRQPTRHEKTRHLEGHDGLFRVRAGDTRAVCKLDAPNLKVLKVGVRDSVYDDIDDIGERMETPA